MQTRMLSDELLDQLALMNGMVIPHQDDRTMDLAQQVFEEGDDLLTGERAMMQSSGQVNALPCWANQQGADDIDTTVMRDAGMHHRRLTPWCPSAFERRNQGKPTLILET